MLFISCQTHEGDLDKFFAHENQARPPSLSNMGKLRLGTKSDIVSCLEGLVPTSKDDAIAVFHPSPSLGVPTVDAVILNGAVIDYASYIFLPYTTRQLEHVHGVDVVWDEYVHDSLKT